MCGQSALCWRRGRGRIRTIASTNAADVSYRLSFLAILLTQITSNTAAVAIVVPITISTFQGLGLNPIPFVYIVAVTGNYGLILPSSSGGCAVAAGYGANLKTMALWGLGLTAFVWVVLAVAGYLLATFWPAFGVA